MERERGKIYLSTARMTPYMATGPEAVSEMSRGLLTNTDRKILRGEVDSDRLASRRSNVRYSFRERMDQLEEDLDILRECDEEQLLAEFNDRFGRVGRLQREVEELREQLDGQD